MHHPPMETNQPGCERVVRGKDLIRLLAYWYALSFFGLIIREKEINEKSHYLFKKGLKKYALLISDCLGDGTDTGNKLI
jgi:hypothetical protein